MQNLPKAELVAWVSRGAYGLEARATGIGRWSRNCADLGGLSDHCTSVYAIQRWSFPVVTLHGLSVIGRRLCF